jgi:hypothetical protein
MFNTSSNKIFLNFFLIVFFLFCMYCIYLATSISVKEVGYEPFYIVVSFWIGQLICIPASIIMSFFFDIDDIFYIWIFRGIGALTVLIFLLYLDVMLKDTE